MIVPVVEKLASSKKAMELVKKMDPLGIVRVLATECGLSPKDASRVTLDLLKKSEGLSGLSVEPNKQFPVPPVLRKYGEKSEKSMLGRPFGKTSFVPGPASVVRYHFPPDPEEEPEGWPFDDHTVAGMNAKNRAPKRGLTANKKLARNNSDSRYHIKKGPFDTDLRLGQPGGDGAGGGGIYSKGFHTSTGDMPGAGNSTWVARGTKGWNSPPGKEFDTPPPPQRKRKRVGETDRPPNAGDNDDEPKFLKQPNTGASSSVNYLGFGGRTPPRASKAGYRGYGRK